MPQIASDQCQAKFQFLAHKIIQHSYTLIHGPCLIFFVFYQIMYNFLTM